MIEISYEKNELLDGENALEEFLFGGRKLHALPNLNMLPQNGKRVGMRLLKLNEQPCQRWRTHREELMRAGRELKILWPSRNELGENEIVRMRDRDFNFAHRLHSFAGALQPVARRLERCEAHTVSVDGATASARCENAKAFCRARSSRRQSAIAARQFCHARCRSWS